MSYKEVPEFVRYLNGLMANYRPPASAEDRTAYISQIKPTYVEAAKKRKQELMNGQDDVLLERFLGDAITDVFYSFTQDDI